MIDINKERIETKLKLWETPGFFQFIEDLDKQVAFGCKDAVVILKRIYNEHIKEIESKQKFKQGKLL